MSSVERPAPTEKQIGEPISPKDAFLDLTAVKQSFYSGKDSRSPIEGFAIHTDGNYLIGYLQTYIYAKPEIVYPEKIDFPKQAQLLPFKDRNITKAEGVPIDLLPPVASYVKEFVVERFQIGKSVKVMREGGSLKSEEFTGTVPRIEDYPFHEKFIASDGETRSGICVLSDPKTETLTLIGQYNVSREHGLNGYETEVRPHFNQLFIQLQDNEITRRFIQKMFENEDPDGVLKSIFGLLQEINPSLDLSQSYLFRNGKSGNL